MLKRLPSANAIVPVFAVISTLTYGWTLVAFLWKLPSWLHYLTPSEILGIYSYSLLTDFTESILLLAFLLFLCVILPPRHLLDVFILRGTVFSLCLIGAVMFVLGFYINNKTTVFGILPVWLVIAVCAFVIMGLLDILSRKAPVVASTLAGLADRLMIFLYLNLPLTFLALAVVAVRNLG
jgi:hypothetical protein